jgi:hypothetical protein
MPPGPTTLPRARATMPRLRYFFSVTVGARIRHRCRRVVETVGDGVVVLRVRGPAWVQLRPRDGADRREQAGVARQRVWT